MPIPALIGAGASVFGNIVGANSQKKANETNLKIAQMNNEWSEKMMQKQMDYNTEMWNKQNEYNDPSAQVERLTKAGVNPALALSIISTGSASAASSPSLPSPSQTQVQPYRYDFSGLGEAVTTALRVQNETKQADAVARFTNMQADYYGAMAMANINKMASETKFNDAKTFYQRLQNNIGADMLGAEYIGKIRQNQSMEVAIHNAIRQGVLMDKEISKYDEKTNAQIADLVASASLKYSQGQMNKEQLKKVISETKGLDLSNREKNAIFNYVVEKARIESFPTNIWTTGHNAFDGIFKFFGK